jgi:hypothetical protein
MGAYHVKTTPLMETMQTMISSAGSPSDGPREGWGHFSYTCPPTPYMISTTLQHAPGPKPPNPYRNQIPCLLSRVALSWLRPVAPPPLPPVLPPPLPPLTPPDLGADAIPNPQSASPHDDPATWRCCRHGFIGARPLAGRPPIPCSGHSSLLTWSPAVAGWPSSPRSAAAPAQHRRPLTTVVAPLSRTAAPFQVGVDGLGRHGRTTTRACSVQARDLQEGRASSESSSLSSAQFRPTFTVCIEFQDVFCCLLVWCCEMNFCVQHQSE